jgi:hypothetical protein
MVAVDLGAVVEPFTGFVMFATGALSTVTLTDGEAVVSPATSRDTA